MSERAEGTSNGLRPRLLAGALAATALDAALLAIGLGGPAALAHDRRALALIAVWGVAAVTLAWLRPVRTHDPLEVRPDRGAMAALFLIPLLTPAFAAWTGRAALWRLPGGAALDWTGVAVVAAGLAIRIAAMARLGSRFSPVVSIQRGHALETGGPYARVRHPGYLGAWLATLGAALAFCSGPALIPAAVFLALLDARARREERLLETHFGDDYRAYRLRTGRLFPGIG